MGKFKKKYRWRDRKRHLELLNERKRLIALVNEACRSFYTDVKPKYTTGIKYYLKNPLSTKKDGTLS